MRKADFEARIRKIEIANRVLHDSHSQTLRVTLDEVALTNENLLELRQFAPSEFVHVEITPCQPTIADALARAASGGSRSAGDNADGAGDLVLVEEDEDVPGAVVRRWEFAK